MMYMWVIIGALVLGAVIAWAALNNRQSAEGERRTEQATRDLYQQEDADNKQHDGIGRS